jgi:membrane protease YdiL (CAAX protease family)
MDKKLYFLLISFLAILLVGFYFTADITNFWISHFAHLGVMTMAGLAIIQFNPKNFPDKKELSFSITDLLASLMGIAGLLGLHNFISVLLTKIAGIDVAGLLNRTSEINRVFVVIISISIFEEILYRRILAQKLYNRLGLKRAVWISALIFSLAHIYTETGILNAFIGGAILAYIYLKTKNIYLSIIAHLLHNITTYLLTPYFAENYATINEYPIIFSVLVIVSALIYGMVRVLNLKEKSTAGIKPADNNTYSK